jgi:hypothetical protein
VGNNMSMERKSIVTQDGVCVLERVEHMHTCIEFQRSSGKDLQRLRAVHWWKVQTIILNYID